MEVNEIPDPSDIQNRYKAFGKKLEKKIEHTSSKADELLSKGAIKHSTTKYLPEDFSNYLMSLKIKTDQSISILPEKFFKKPIFLHREKYFSRLASELIISGLSYQRVNLKPLKLGLIAELFSKHRPWWDFQLKDIEKALNVLKKEKIIQKTSEGFLFEPMSLSIDIHEFFYIVNQHLNPYGEIPIRSIHTYIPWSQDKIEQIIRTLKANSIIVVDDARDVLYFPEYSRG